MYLFVGSVWSITAVFTLFLLIERWRGVRLMPRVRGFLDAKIEKQQQAVGDRVPMVNQRFFRQFFHYSVHLSLSRFLRILKNTEEKAKKMLHLNKAKARVVLEPKVDSHLAKVAAHKEEIALTDKQKQIRKKAAIEGKI